MSKNILKIYYKIYICHDIFTFSNEDIEQYLRYFDLKEKKENLTSEEIDEYISFECSLYLTVNCGDCDEKVEITKEFILENKQNPKNYCYKLNN